MSSVLQVIFDTWTAKNNSYLADVERQYRRSAVADGTPESVYGNPKWKTVVAAPPEAELSEFLTSDIPVGERGILDAMAPINKTLGWFHNKTEQWCSKNDGRSDTSCVLVGNVLEAPIRLGHIMMGFMYVGPGNIYPAHAHSAAEAYHILAGTCFLSKSNSPFVQKSAGDVITHEPYEVHEMRTRESGVLVLWVNTGNFEHHYYIQDQAQSKL
eukprot:gnl/MRDRNA2_/MRDRNA2_220941_c0_seq1.p1 gnl/MRDRNA2_/MRDRNA2_220941_c0~~gnl/MRDRNA2_/MRDRNA2_220941_c0_seq1.p1  ORF type:complete len:213 (+),score=30.59 gnl/MRDRNA2_/MRDRNA2_220941_c0_seq1:77-715(+)